MGTTRVAVALTAYNESELVVIARLAAVSGARDHQLVVPALDAEATAARVAELLGENAAVVTVEPAHEYLERGHDCVVSMSDDPSERGRSVAAVATALVQGTTIEADRTPTPSELIAWLARHTPLRVPDALGGKPRRGAGSVEFVADEQIVLRTRWGSNLVAVSPSAAESGLLLDGVYDPAAIRAIDAVVGRGDRVVDASAGIGATAVHLARRVGATGHAFAFTTGDDHEVLVENVRLNGVDGWTSVSDDDVTVGDQKVALLRVDGAARTARVLDDHDDALADGRVQRVLFRVEPLPVRPSAATIEATLRRIRRQYGAAFARVGPGGALSPVSVDDVLACAESHWTMAHVA